MARFNEGSRVTETGMTVDSRRGPSACRVFGARPKLRGEPQCPTRPEVLYRADGSGPNRVRLYGLHGHRRPGRDLSTVSAVVAATATVAIPGSDWPPSDTSLRYASLSRPRHDVDGLSRFLADPRRVLAVRRRHRQRLAADVLRPLGVHASSIIPSRPRQAPARPLRLSALVK